jgi:hypothetical protein
MFNKHDWSLIRWCLIITVLAFLVATIAGCSIPRFNELGDKNETNTEMRYLSMQS